MPTHLLMKITMNIHFHKILRGKRKSINRVPSLSNEKHEKKNAPLKWPLKSCRFSDLKLTTIQ